MKAHYISRFYLEGFSDPDTPDGNEPYVWAYSIETRSWKKRSPRKVATAKDYYLQPNSVGIPPDSVEAFLSLAETKAAPILRDLISTKAQLSRSDRYTFAVFIGLMMLRVPAYRNRIRAATKALVLAHLTADLDEAKADPAAWGKLTARYMKLTGQPMPYAHPDEVDIDRVLGTLKPAKLVGMQIIPLQGIATTLFQMQWTFLISSGRDYFVSSDNPFNSLSPQGPDGLFHYERDLQNSRVELSIPLARSLALLATWGRHKEGFIECGRDVVAQTNVASCGRAEIAIYSPARAFPGSERIIDHLDQPFWSRFDERLPQIHEFGVDPIRLMAVLGMSPEEVVLERPFFWPGAEAKGEGERYWAERRIAGAEATGWQVGLNRVFRVAYLRHGVLSWVEVGGTFLGSDILVSAIFEASEGFVISIWGGVRPTRRFARIGRALIRRVEYFGA